MDEGTEVASRPRRRSRRGLVALLVVVLVVAGAGAYAILGASKANAATATVAVVRDAMEAQKAGAAFAPALDGDVLVSGDQVRTDANGFGFLTFFDGSTVEVDPGAQVSVTEATLNGDGSFVIRIQQTVGRTWASVQHMANPNSRFEIRTPASTAVVRGTAFETIVAADGSTTIETADGTVLVQAQGQTQSATANTRVTTQPGQAPAAPQPLPPGPALRFTSSDGTGLTAFDPNGLACGSGRADAPGCTSGSVDLRRAIPGTYVVLMAASTSVNATLSMEGQLGPTTVSTQSLQRQMARGDLVRTTVAVTLDGQGRPMLGTPTPFELLSTVCGAEGRGRVFSGGTLDERAAALSQYAAQNRSQAAALVYSDAELTAGAQRALASAQGVPVTVTNVRIQTTIRGLQFSGDVSVGPVNVHAVGRVIAGEEGGRLLLRLADLDLGFFNFIADQLRSRIEPELASAGDSLPLRIDRVAFRAGCVAIVGVTR